MVGLLQLWFLKYIRNCKSNLSVFQRWYQFLRYNSAWRRITPSLWYPASICAKVQEDISAFRSAEHARRKFTYMFIRLQSYRSCQRFSLARVLRAGAGVPGSTLQVTWPLTSSSLLPCTASTADFTFLPFTQQSLLSVKRAGAIACAQVMLVHSGFSFNPQCRLR